MGVPKERSSCVVGLVWDHNTAFLLVGDLAQATRTSQPARELQGLGSGVAAGLGVQLSDGLEALMSLVPAGQGQGQGAGPGVAKKLEQFGFTQDPCGDKAGPRCWLE